MKSLKISRSRRRTPPKRPWRHQPKDYSRLVRRAGQALLSQIRLAKLNKLRQTMVASWYQTPIRGREETLRQALISLPKMNNWQVVEGLSQRIIARGFSADIGQMLLAVNWIKEALVLFDLSASFPKDKNKALDLVAEITVRLQRAQPKPLLNRLGKISDQELQHVVDFLLASISIG